MGMCCIELPGRPGVGCVWTGYLDNNHLDGDVLRQTDGGTEVLRQRHQQVQDGNNAFGVDG